MQIKLVFGAMLLAVLLAVGWKHLGSGDLPGWRHPQQVSLPVIEFDHGAPSAGAPPQRGLAATPGSSLTRSGIRKCRTGETVVYTDADCPVGSVEQAIGAGSVTVVAAQHPAPALPQLQASGIPNARDLLLGPALQSEGANLRDQRMEQVINR